MKTRTPPPPPLCPSKPACSAFRCPSGMSSSALHRLASSTLTIWYLPVIAVPFPLPSHLLAYLQLSSQSWERVSAIYTYTRFPLTISAAYKGEIVFFKFNTTLPPSPSPSVCVCVFVCTRCTTVLCPPGFGCSYLEKSLHRRGQKPKLASGSQNQY